ncbi:MAG TPA: radical SAM protein [Treponemataceae bacterium]|nr:radical SAM protein [Treponemataceae bacterium]HQL05217.1 radical SAM protein [Treponemataceae bacterium]
MEQKYVSLMNKSIANLVWDAVDIARKYPSYVVSFFRIALHQRTAQKIREKNRENKIPVPAFMILSITRKCNLSCKGCYSHATFELEKKEGRGAELDSQNLQKVVKDGSDLGVSFMLLAGGEPLVRSADIFTLARENPLVIFPVFTNGTLIDEEIISQFKKYKNIFPILSIEGKGALTDNRRGKGVYDSAVEKMQVLQKNGIFFGLSFTVTKQNLEEVISAEFIESLCSRGAGLFFYNEYTPVEKGTEELCISAEERKILLSTLEEYRRRFKKLFLAFPGDEDQFGGCLSAGRGFVHVAPDGRLEACPFAPFGDTSVSISLKEALKSKTLSAIREHHDELHETAFGCALWNKREWVESLVKGEKF